MHTPYAWVLLIGSLWLVCLTVCGVNDRINTSGDSLDTCHNHQSLISPGANCDLLFCSVLISFHAANHSGLPALFLYALLETYQHFSINHVWPVFCFLKPFAFCHSFFSQNMFLIYICLYVQQIWICCIFVAFVLLINQSIYNVLCVCTNASIRVYNVWDFYHHLVFIE